MAAEIVPFSDEETRVLVNLEQQYEVWIEAERALAALPYNLKWKTVRGKDYLYEVIDRTGNAKSLGPNSPENHAVFARYQSDKATATNRRDESRGSCVWSFNNCGVLSGTDGVEILLRKALSC